MDVLKSVLAAREDRSPQVDSRIMGNVAFVIRHNLPTPLSDLLQVQALLDCLSDAAFNLQVCICSVGKQEPSAIFIPCILLILELPRQQIAACQAGRLILPCCCCQVVWAAPS